MRSQAQFLQLHGIGELVDEGRAAWTAAAARPDVRAVAMRSRVAESEALLDPAGLGGFSVLEWVSRASPRASERFDTVSRANDPTP